MIKHFIENTLCIKNVLNLSNLYPIFNNLKPVAILATLIGIFLLSSSKDSVSYGHAIGFAFSQLPYPLSFTNSYVCTLNIDHQFLWIIMHDSAASHRHTVS